jgi:hypothetical protein
MTRPCARVYGAFATREDALAHADVVQGVDATCSLVIAQRGEWLLFPQTEAVRDDPDERMRRLTKRLDVHRDARADADAEFDRVVRERADRPAPRDVPVDDDEDADAEKLVYPPPRRLRAGAEVRGQSAVALCAIPDPVGGECLLKILGCFETAAEADNWARNVASRRVTDEDIVVAPTCEWFYPNGDAKASREHYRSDELQRIMDAAARNPQAVREYKEWKAEQDALEEQQKALEDAQPKALEDVRGEEDEAPEVLEEID